MLRPMEPESRKARDLLDMAGEYAGVITSVIGQLAEQPHSGAVTHGLAVASRMERDDLRALVATGRPSVETCELAMRRLARLDRLLCLAVEGSAESCSALADRLALAEEFELHRPGDRPTSAGSARLSRRLDRLSRRAAAACPPS
jgi:hypothetical protein